MVLTFVWLIIDAYAYWYLFVWVFIVGRFGSGCKITLITSVKIKKSNQMKKKHSTVWSVQTIEYDQDGEHASILTHTSNPLRVP